MAAKYLNTDINLKARFDLSPLVNELDRLGLYAISGPERRGSIWSVVLESSAWRGTNPKIERRTEDILNSIEALEGEHLTMWKNCFLKEFDIGFEYDGNVFSSVFRIAPDHALRIAKAELGIVMTIYQEFGHEERDEICSNS